MAFKTLAYVTNAESNNVSVIDIIKNEVEYTIPLEPDGERPTCIAITPDRKYAYITNGITNNVSVIDVIENTVEYIIPVQGDPSAIAITPDGNYAYVTNTISNSMSVIDTNTKDVINISLLSHGYGPWRLAITPDGNFVYVAYEYSNSISVIDTSENMVEYTILLEGFASGIAITSDGNYAYVTSVNTNNVFVINISERVVEYTIPVGGSPFGIAITPDGSYAYVTNTGSDDVSVIDTNEKVEEYTISVRPDGDGPSAIAITPDGSYAYVTNTYSDNVSVININEKAVKETIIVGNNPSGIAMVNVPIEGIADLSVTMKGYPNSVVVDEELTYTITVRNSGPDRATGVTLIDKLPIGVSFISATTSHGIWNESEGVFTCNIDSLGSREAALITIVVIPRQEGSITNTATVKGNELDPNPDNNTAVVITSVYSPIIKNFAYVANSGSNNVSVIDISNNTIEGGPIYVGEQPFDVAITPDGQFAFVVNNFSNNVSRINTRDNQTVGFPINVGSGPYGIDINPLGTYVYVTNIYSDNLYKIKTETNAIEGSPIDVGDGPVKIAITPNGEFAYVTNYFSHDVTIVDLVENQAVGSPIPVGSNPFDIAITPNGRYAYVTSLGTDQVYVIDTDTNKVVFEPIPVGDGPFGIAITPDGKYAYIANYYSQNVYVIETFGRTLVNIIPVKGAIDIAITRNGSYAYVVNYNANDVSVIDTNTYEVIKDSIPVGVYPRAIAISESLILQTLTADLSVTKTDLPDPVKLGDYLTYNLTVTNHGVDQATGVMLKDDLPPTATFVSVESSQGTCSEEDGIVTCELGSLDNGESVIITIVIIPTQTGIITNTATVLANEEDLDLSNNTVVQNTMVLETACIEAPRIFDSCFQEEKIERTFGLPQYCHPVDSVDCSVKYSKCNIEEASEPDDQGNVNVQLSIKVSVDIKVKFKHHDFIRNFRKVFYFTESVTLYVPNGATITCKVKNVSCKCDQIKKDKLRCTVNFTVIAKSKTFVQIEIPYLDISELKPCED